jgi:hypothetical protein
MQVMSTQSGRTHESLPYLMRYRFMQEDDSANYLDPDELHTNVFPAALGDLHGDLVSFRVYVNSGHGHHLSRFLHYAMQISKALPKVRLHFRNPGQGANPSTTMSVRQQIGQISSAGPFNFSLTLHTCSVVNANTYMLGIEGVASSSKVKPLSLPELHPRHSRRRTGPGCFAPPLEATMEGRMAVFEESQTALRLSV